MANLLPHLLDMPMSLGDHLHELRRRLIVPIIALGALFLLAFFFQGDLKILVAKPMKWAIEKDLVLAANVGLHPDTFKFVALDVMESAMVSMSVSFYAALFVAFPILVYQLWMFVGVGLLPKERRLAFLFVPAGIMFFYAGAVVGYFIGLPQYYAWMIKWTAHDPTTTFGLQLSPYHKNFFLMTMIFGLIADIPWLIMVIVRVGFVTVEQLGKHRKMAILVNTLVAALITPPDGLSMLIMMIPLFGLFELGLLLSRVMMWHHHRMTKKEEAAELKRMAAEELAAHQAHASAAATPTDRDERTMAGPDVPVAPLPGPTASDHDRDEPRPVPRSSGIVDDLAAGDQVTDTPSAPILDSPEEPDAGPNEEPRVERPVSDDPPGPSYDEDTDERAQPLQGADSTGEPPQVDREDTDVTKPHGRSEDSDDHLEPRKDDDRG